MTRDEYEQKLDELKGECRDIQENLEQEMYMPCDAYKHGSADWCRRLAQELDNYRYALESLADEFDFLEEDRKAEDESDDEED